MSAVAIWKRPVVPTATATVLSAIVFPSLFLHVPYQCTNHISHITAMTARVQSLLLCSAVLSLAAAAQQGPGATASSTGQQATNAITVHQGQKQHLDHPQQSIGAVPHDTRPGSRVQQQALVAVSGRTAGILDSDPPGPPKDVCPTRHYREQCTPKHCIWCRNK